MTGFQAVLLAVRIVGYSMIVAAAGAIAAVAG